jgi:histidine triad (HIT) family protein
MKINSTEIEMKDTKQEQKNCIFCKIIRGKIPSYKVWENKKYFAFLDINPINPGHLLLIPKKHENYIFDLNNKEYLELMKNAKFLAKEIKRVINCKRVGIAVEGFFVPHVHIHLVPLNNGNELNPERAKSMNNEELKKIQENYKLKINKKQI